MKSVAFLISLSSLVAAQSSITFPKDGINERNDNRRPVSFCVRKRRGRI